MKRSTPHSSAAPASRRVPRTLFLIASHGFSSISGTCLCAAAWKTISGSILPHHLADAVRIGDVADHRMQAEPLAAHPRARCRIACRLFS